MSNCVLFTITLFQIKLAYTYVLNHISISDEKYFVLTCYIKIIFFLISLFLILTIVCEVEINTNFALKYIAGSPNWRSHDHKWKSLPVKWPSHVPFANGLLEGPFVKGLSCSLSFGTSLQMASPSRSALQGRKKAIWNSPYIELVGVCWCSVNMTVIFHKILNPTANLSQLVCWSLLAFVCAVWIGLKKLIHGYRKRLISVIFFQRGCYHILS